VLGNVLSQFFKRGVTTDLLSVLPIEASKMHVGRIIVSKSCSNYSVGGADRLREELDRQFPRLEEAFDGIQPPEGESLSGGGRIRALGSIQSKTNVREHLDWAIQTLRRLKDAEGFWQLPGNRGRLQTPRKRKTSLNPRVLEHVEQLRSALGCG